MSMQTELTRLKNAKAAIKAYIEGKGLTVPEGTLLDGMASMLESIEAGGGGRAKIITGEFTLDTVESGVLVDHNLSEVPNFAYYFALLAPSASNQLDDNSITRFFAIYLDGVHYSYYVSGGASNRATKYGTYTYDISKIVSKYNSSGTYCTANSATNSTIIIGGCPSTSYGRFKNATTYKWGVGVI